MKPYEEIKKEFSDKNYSTSELKKGIFLFSIGKFLFSEFFVMIISSLPFIAGYSLIAYIFGHSILIAFFYLVLHILFFSFYVRKVYRNELLEHHTEAELIIKALRELIQEKSN